MASQSADTGRHRSVGSRALNARRRAQLSRRFYLLTAASTLVPGLGLIPTRRRAGQFIIGGFVLTLLLVCGYGLVAGVTDSVIKVGVSRTALVSLVLIVLIGAAVWIWGIIATARDNMPGESRGGSRMAKLVFAGFAAVLIFAPAAQAMRYAVIQQSVIGEVFQDLNLDGAATPGGGDDPWAGVEQVNIMLVGSDAADNREGVRPDSVIVASINPQSGRTVLFGIPRNLQNVPFSADNPLSEKWPQGFNCGDECLFEHVWQQGVENKKLFPGDPNPGLTVTKDAASQVLGLKVDYTAVVDLKGFTQLVDAMGGVTMDVQERVCIGCSLQNGVVVGTTGYIETGVQKLSGYEALWYARSRAESQDGDYSRMRRQRCVVGALVEQVNPTTMVTRYPALAQTLKDNVRVGIPQQHLDDWAKLVLHIQKEGNIESLPLTQENINPTRPDYAKIHAMVDKAVDPPKPKPKKKPTSTASESPTAPAPSPSTSKKSKDQLADINETC